MQVNVVNIIIDAILGKGSCSIESLGTFTLNSQSAILTKGKTELQAPQKSITFSEEIVGDVTLEDELLSIYPFSPNKAKKVVSIFSNKVINGLLNFDQVNLKNLGALTQREDNITFELSEQLERILNRTLPNIDLNPLLRDKKAEQTNAKEQLTPIAPPTKTAKEAEKVIENKEVLDVKKEVVQDKLSAERVQDHARLDFDKSEPAKSKEKPIQEFVYEEDESFLSRFLPWILLLLTLGAVYFGITKFIQFAKQSDDQSTVSQHIDENVDNETIQVDSIEQSDSADEEMNTAEEKEIPTNTAKEKTTQKETAPQEMVRPDECIIIAGSYMLEENIDDMAAKIRAMGYEVYTEKYGYYIRVGFAFPCNDPDLNLDLYIEEVRAKLSKSAWYLVPDLSI